MEWIFLNWFDILKNARLAQRQRQGFKLDDKDEAYVLEEDDDCRKEFIKIAEKVKNSFPSSETILKYSHNESRGSAYSSIHKYDGFDVEVTIYIANEGEIPDDAYCKAIEDFKALRPPSGNTVEEYGELLISSFKKGTLYLMHIDISPEHEPETYDFFPSYIDVIVKHYDKYGKKVHPDKDYKLHTEFDNWSGFF
tara:strand:- start:152 stop:736 length:585 start_codon:yes stop_codon:yes gene_type:complete